MEPSMHTNSTSACDTSTCEAIDTKSVLVGFMIGMVLCSPCVWLTGRRLLRNIKTKLSQRYNITTPDEDDSFRLLSNQNHHNPAKNQGRHSGCTSDNKNETDSLLEFGIDQDHFHLNTESFSKLKRDEESGIVDLDRSESNSITDIFKTTHVLEGRHSGCTVHMKNETDSLLAFAIGKDKFNLDTESHSKLKGDEESGIVDLGRSKSITDIFETTNFLGDTIDLKGHLWINLSEYDILDCMPVETELKLTSPANSNDKDQTNLNQSTNTEQALALVDENVGTSNDEDQTNLNQSTNTEQALAIVNENIDTNNDRERSTINWDVVFQKCVDLVKPLEYYQFFITLFVSGAFIDNQTCYNRFEYEYNVLQKLVNFEEKAKRFDDALAIIKELQSTVSALQRTSDGSSYVRWGHSACPNGSTAVYQGYAAGAHYTHSGGGANVLCLHSDPKWNKYVDGYQSVEHIYGAEYYTSGYSFQSNAHLHNVPCVVCRIPRSNVLMVPGTNVCDKDFRIEYSGYVMTEHYGHANNADYICVDEEFNTVDGGAGSHPGKYLLFVQAVCGGIKCPPYVAGRELTCAVCSFDPIAQSKQLQPYA